MLSILHGATRTVLMEVTDPSYLAEPYMVSKSFQASPNPVATQTPCVSTFEGHEPGDSVPHFAPDKNPFAAEFVRMYNLPREAVLGYPETLIPSTGSASRTATGRRRRARATAAPSCLRPRDSRLRPGCR